MKWIKTKLMSNTQNSYYHQKYKSEPIPWSSYQYRQVKPSSTNKKKNPIILEN